MSHKRREGREAKRAGCFGGAPEDEDEYPIIYATPCINGGICSDQGCALFGCVREIEQETTP